MSIPLEQIAEQSRLPAAMIMTSDQVVPSYHFMNFTTDDDGRPAVELMNRQDFDLVITDYTMPEMNGRELVAWIRQQSRQKRFQWSLSRPSSPQPNWRRFMNWVCRRSAASPSTWTWFATLSSGCLFEIDRAFEPSFF